MKKSPYERLWKHIVKGIEENDCWTWVGGKNNVGYAMIKGVEHKKMVLAHRVMGEHLGLEGPEIQRTCRNYDCLNPLHLKSGTSKGRIENNERTGQFKLREYRHKHEHVPCPVCGEVAYYPTLKLRHKQCYPDYKRDK